MGGGERLAGKRDVEEIIGQYIINFFKGIYKALKTVYYGIKKLPEKKSNFYILAVFAAVGIGLFLFKEKIWQMLPQDNNKMLPLKYGMYLTPGLPLLFLYFKGEEHEKFISSFDEKFAEVGLFVRGKRRNLNGQMEETQLYPRFLGEVKEGDITTYSFFSKNSLKEWLDKVDRLENVLDCNILKIENALTTKQVIKIKTVPASKIIPLYIEWKDEFLSDKDFELIVGEDMLEQIKFDLNKNPHVLIAGETGSGKSVILRLLLGQSALKGAKIYMVDFKGGVEFGIRYEKFGEVITERQRVLEVLKDLTVENAIRLKLFRKMDVKNLAEYNEWAEKTNEKTLCRIVIFIDELAEMTDKDGMSKEDKALVAQIEKELSTLARLSRATGINLIIGIQRPDAKVLTGQIKNNVPVRISGRFADKPASEIVLSNSEATKLPEVKGRFLFKVGADTYQFQAYNFDDKRMLKSSYQQTGGMLTVKDLKELEQEEITAADLEELQGKEELMEGEDIEVFEEEDYEEEEVYEGF